jgi:hypothetical protein
MIRFYFYALAGIILPLLGWVISQGLMIFIPPLKTYPEIIVFPCIAACLSMGMVINEIFLSNPIRRRLNFRRAKMPILYALGMGISGGFLVGGILQFAYLPNLGLSDRTARVLGWICIGVTVGLVEGVTWKFRSMEAGDVSRRNKRLYSSLFGATLGASIAAAIFEAIRGLFETSNSLLKTIEDPIGLCLLGLVLGTVFSLTTSPSYLAALRAGKGFEYRQIELRKGEEPLDKTVNFNLVSPPPVISSESIKSLKFVSEREGVVKIDEGLSIQLPDKGSVQIGGIAKNQAPNGKFVGSDIYLPGLPPHVATIDLDRTKATLIPNPTQFERIEVNGNRLKVLRDVSLKHNTLIAFYTDEPDDYNPKQKKMYRFVYYNRFLDPES